MAQTVFEKIIEERSVADRFKVDSAGLGDWHTSDKADPRMRSHAEKRGYNITHRARQVKKSDFDEFDYIVAMDEQNVKGLYQLAKTDEHKAKVLRMTDFLQELSADYVPDPYYGGPEGFEHVIDLLEDACEGFFQAIESKKL